MSSLFFSRFLFHYAMIAFVYGKIHYASLWQSKSDTLAGSHNVVKEKCDKNGEKPWIQYPSEHFSNLAPRKVRFLNLKLLLRIFRKLIFIDVRRLLLSGCEQIGRPRLHVTPPHIRVGCDLLSHLHCGRTVTWTNLNLAFFRDQPCANVKPQCTSTSLVV